MFFAIYWSTITYVHKFNFYKVKEIMTRIIRMILIDVLYLHREKDNITISVVYVAKTGASGYRIRR